MIVPGTDLTLTVEHDDGGGLTRLAVGATVHLERLPDGAWRLGGDLCTVRELQLPRGLRRRVRAGGEAWTERYAWDDEGRPTEVDGVSVERDEHGRVTACGAWRYDYDRHGLNTIAGPHGERTIVRGDRGRPVRARERAAGDDRETTAFEYGPDGRRSGVGKDPPGWARDVLGRLWTVRDEHGEIVATYLWSGWSCIGRIDGPPDRPLAAAFMLDPTGTPVRVVTRAGARRIPRDAFGEALLSETGVPGLYGGPVHDGLVRLPARALDPRTGAFDRPDPLDGEPGDPRRAGGFTGLLPVDRAPDGAYAVCRNDPVGRTDPSGAISATAIPVALSSLTWSSQYNIVNFVFLQLFVNLLPSLVTTDDRGRWSMRRFFSMEGMASTRGGGFGLRFDPIGLELWVKLFAGEARRFTLHHVFWCPAHDEAWDGLRIIRMFAPAAAFEPSLYGTLLRAEPARAKRFALKGSANSGPQLPRRAAEDWTRAGGAAVAVFPGSRQPRFPAGGLHFAPRGDRNDPRNTPEAVGPQDGRIAELAPDGTLAQGTVAAQSRLNLPDDGLELAQGAKVVVIEGDKPELHEVRQAVERDGATFVRLAADLATATTTGLQIRGATVSATADTLPLLAQPDRLDARAPASTVRYALGDILEVSQGAVVVGARKVTGLEARVTLDAAPPAGLRLPWEVYFAQPRDAARPVTKAAADELEFPAGQEPPDEGDPIVVAGGGATMAVRVTGEPADRRRRVDRPLAAALTGDLTWRPLVRAGLLGRVRTAPAAGSAAIAYVPDVSGGAPAAGTSLLIEGDDVALRSVASLDADELKLGDGLPGAAGTACTVKKVALGDPDVEGVKVEQVQALTLQPAQDRSGRTLELVQLAAAAAPPFPVGTTLIQQAALAGNVATVAFPVTAPVALPNGEGGTEGPTPGQLVSLDTGAGPATAAIVRAVRLTVALDRPVTVTAPLDCVPLEPAGFTYLAEQLGPRRILVRPEAREPGLPPTVEPVELPRFAAGEPVEVQWSGGPGPRLYRIVSVDGSTIRLDRDGPPLPADTPGLTVQRLDAADPGTGGSRIARNGTLTDRTVLTVDVWQANALAVGDTIAVTDSADAVPARIAERRRLEVEWLPVTLPAAATTVTIATVDRGASPNTAVVASVEQDGAEIVLADGALTPGPNVVMAIEYATERGAAAGEFGAGAVVAPEEPTVELSRFDSLIEHELVHMVQSAIWGPILLSPLPFRGIEEIYEALADEPYPDWLHHLGKVYSVGGLMNLITSSVISALAWVLLKLIAFFVRLFSGQPLSPGWLGHADWLPFHAASIPDAAQPSRIRLAAAGQPALSQGDLVEVTDGAVYRRASVTAVAGTTVDLAEPAPAGGPLQVALVAEGDETSLVEHAVMRHTGFGGAEAAFDIIFDPWSQISYRGGLDPGSFEDILFRCARDLFGSSSWTFFPFGYFFWDNAIRNRGNKGHLSKMEQSASEESGELYSPLSRISGQLDVVGDVARFWHFIESRHGTVVVSGSQDAPGVHVDDLVRTMPSVRRNPALSNAARPNEDFDTAPDAQRPGAQVPDALAAKERGRPADAVSPAGNLPRGFAPLPDAMVPVGARVERCVGAYVGFTRPPGGGGAAHRVTTRDGIASAADGWEAQQEGKQQLWFDRTVQDVVVTIGGRTVAEGDRVTLLRGQEATVTVTPNGARRYAADVLQPGDGPVLRATGLKLQAQAMNGVEPAEIVRVYTYDPVARRFDHPGMNVHGMHLPRDVRVPVRRFEVEVTDVVPVRSAPDPRTPALAGPARAGDTVYLIAPLVPDAGQFRLSTVTYPAGAPPTTVDPAPAIGTHAASADVQPLVAPGVIYRVNFSVNDPPEARAELEFTLPVGGFSRLEFDLTALVELVPHFTLDAAGFAVARSARLDLTCSGGVTPGAVTVTPAAGVAASTVGNIVRLDVAAAAPGHSHRARHRPGRRDPQGAADDHDHMTGGAVA